MRPPSHSSRRRSELINAGGVKVDPALVDAVASDDPGVRDAAAFAHLDAHGVTCVALAFVPGPDLDTQQLIARLAARLGPAAPARLVQVTSIPRNAMGKVRRDRLAAICAAGRAPGPSGS